MKQPKSLPAGQLNLQHQSLIKAIEDKIRIFFEFVILTTLFLIGTKPYFSTRGMHCDQRMGKSSGAYAVWESTTSSTSTLPENIIDKNVRRKLSTGSRNSSEKELYTLFVVTRCCLLSFLLVNWIHWFYCDSRSRCDVERFHRWRGDEIAQVGLIFGFCQ